jgi:hypothetical protein
MSEKLDEIQIIQLFAYCRKQNIPHYDLQIEIVDHLAAIIESRWEREPNLPFRIVLNQMKNEFDTYGFNLMKTERKKVLRKKYNRMLGNYVLEFFKLPKVILTLFIVFFLITASHSLMDYRFIFYSYLGFNILTIIVYIDLFPGKFRVGLIQGKQFLINEYLESIKRHIFQIGQIPILVHSIILMFNQRYWKEILIDKYLLSFEVIFLTILCILFVGLFFYIPNRIKADFTREYPQFVKS